MLMWPRPQSLLAGYLIEKSKMKHSLKVGFLFTTKTHTLKEAKCQKCNI